MKREKVTETIKMGFVLDSIVKKINKQKPQLNRARSPELGIFLPWGGQQSPTGRRKAPLHSW